MPVRNPQDRNMLEMVPDESSPDPAFQVQKIDLMDKLESLLSQLSDKHQEVLARRFGLRGFDTSTLEEVGSEIGLTRERVRQIQVEGLLRLRRSLEDQGLNPEQIFG